MTFFDNLKNKLFKEENSGKGKDSQPAEKSKNLQNKIKGLFAKKPDEVEQAVEDLDMSQESQETSRYQRSKQKKPIDTTKPLGKVQAFLSKFTLSPRNPIRRFWRRYHIGKILFNRFWFIITGHFLNKHNLFTFVIFLNAIFIEPPSNQQII